MSFCHFSEITTIMSTAEFSSGQTRVSLGIQAKTSFPQPSRTSRPQPEKTSTCRTNTVRGSSCGLEMRSAAAARAQQIEHLRGADDSARMLAALGNPVKVAACRRQKVELVHEATQTPFFLRAVIGMENLDRIEARLGELADQPFRILVPDGVRQRGDASGRADRRDHVDGGPLFRGD